jgi:secreted trypsin-like serine protease
MPFNKPLESVSRIIGGKEANAHSWPWQVMVTDGMIMCGAALISNEWLLTAAHCTEKLVQP